MVRSLSDCVRQSLDLGDDFWSHVIKCVIVRAREILPSIRNRIVHASFLCGGQAGARVTASERAGQMIQACQKIARDLGDFQTPCDGWRIHRQKARRYAGRAWLGAHLESVWAIRPERVGRHIQRLQAISRAIELEAVTWCSSCGMCSKSCKNGRREGTERPTQSEPSE